MENIQDILDMLEEKEKIMHNPFASIPNKRLREALNYLEETAAEITPPREPK